MVALHDAIGAVRQADLERLESLVVSGSSVILSGERGLGKTFVAARMTKRLQAAGQAVSVVRVTRGQSVQLDPEIGEARQNAPVLIIDDAHRLGVDDLRLLVDAVDARRTVLVTLDPRSLDRSSADGAQRKQLLTSLWTELGLERIDLSGVGFAEAIAIIEETSGRINVDVATRAGIVSRAAGNPMLLRELTREELHRARYGANGQILPLGPVVMSSRALDLADPVLSSLSEEEEYALVTLAKIGTVNYARACRLVGSEPVRSLLRRGLVTQEARSTDSLSANYLFASAALASQEIGNRLEAAHSVELLLIDDHRAGTPLSATECVLVANYWANDPEVDPLERLPAPTAASILARAARQAHLWGLPNSAEIFARRSLSILPSSLALEQVSRCLATRGNRTGALELLESNDVPHTEPEEDADLLAWWMTAIAWHPDEPGPGESRLAVLEKEVRAWGTVDAQLDALLAIHSARKRLVSTSYSEGNGELEAIAHDETMPLEIRLRAVTELVPSYAYAAGPAELCTLFDQGRELVALIAQRSTGADASQNRRAAIVGFLAHVGIFRSITGLGRANLQLDLDSYALKAVDLDDRLAQAIVNLVASFDALARNDLPRAEIESSRALERIDSGSHPTWSLWISIVRSQTLCMLGHTDEALAIAREAPVQAHATSPWTNYYSRQLDIRIRARTGDTAGARRASLALAAMEGNGSRLMTLQGLHGALALGESTERMLELIPPVTQETDHDVSAAREEHIRADAASDAYRLDAVGKRFAALQMLWEAKMAFRSAQAMHESHGRIAEGAASAARARALGTAAGTDGDAARQTVTNDKLQNLTRRELEVARLAGSGLSNSEIAKRLFLSVRTVESHVLQARAKLGVGRRSELRQFLANDIDRESA